MKGFVHRSTVTRAERAKLAEELTELVVPAPRMCSLPGRSRRSWGPDGSEPGVTGGDAGDGSEQTLHVVIGYVDARAGPDSPRHRSAILASRLVAVTVYLFAGEPEQPDQVGIRAEAAVPYSDRVLGCQPCRHQRVRDALHGEGGDWQRLGVQVRAEEADPGIAARPRRNDSAMRRS